MRATLKHDLDLLWRSHALVGFRRLVRANIPVDTEGLAQYLIGKFIVHDTENGRLAGRIVETEAYTVVDSAGHAFRGRTSRNGALYLDPGHAYVYLIYGVSYMLNVSSEKAGVGAGVLLRAIEPPTSIDTPEITTLRKLWADAGRGPGRLTKVLKIDLQQDGLDLCGPRSAIWLGGTSRKAGPIGKSVRIGITHGADRLLRFFERGNQFISGPKSLLQG